jgi:anaerobic magnesium-protoporphyrin IX monomethyl ester cyclase
VRILIVNPYSLLYKENKHYDPCIPFGVLFVATVMKKHGYQVKIFDHNVESRSFNETLSAFKPDVVGFSVLTGETIRDAIAMSKDVCAYNADTSIVWGGVHPSLLPFQTIVSPYIDYVVVGEGEYTFLELVQHLENNANMSTIQGICYVRKEDGKPVYTGDRPFIDNLDVLPDPDWELVDINAYKKYFILNTSRGCPHRCTFCYNQKFNKGRRSDFSAGRIVGWMEYLNKNYGIDNFDFLEDNFTFNKKRLDEFLELMIRNKMKVTWSCESRITGVSKELLMKMKQAGCDYLTFGVESGSPRILQFLKKDIKIDTITTVIKWCHDIGIKSSVNMMFGLPHETDEDVEMSFNLIRKCNPLYVDAIIYRPFPGTELFDYCIEHGLFSMPSTLEEWAEISDVHAFNYSLKGNDANRLKKILQRNDKMNMQRQYQRKIKEILCERPTELINPKNYLKLIKQSKKLLSHLFQEHSK